MIAKIAVSAATYAIDKPYSYKIPEGMTLQPGQRVQLPFGRANKRTEGVVLTVETGSEEKLKAVERCLDEAPILSEHQLRLAAFLRERYFCTFYECLRVMLPAGLWFQARERISLTGDRSWKEKAIRKDGAAEVLALLENLGGQAEESALRALIPDEETLSDVIAYLARKKWISAETEYLRRANDKTEKIAALAVSAEEAMEYASHRPKSAAMQKNVLELMCGVGSVSVKELCYFTGASTATVNRLEKLGYLTLTEQPVLRCREIRPAKLDGPLVLSPDQQRCYDGLAKQMAQENPGVALLRGVTGSGKTSVYIKLIQTCLETGRSTLLLVPEIALTPQLLGLMTAYFGAQVAVLHSSLGAGERYDQWKRVRSGDAKVVVGTRSAVFAPCTPGLIILDEEQEHSYKSENSPRYSAKEVAIWRGAKEGALVLLGSATPSVESMYRAKTGAYRLYTMAATLWRTEAARRGHRGHAGGAEAGKRSFPEHPSAGSAVRQPGRGKADDSAAQPPGKQPGAGVRGLPESAGMSPVQRPPDLSQRQQPADVPLLRLFPAGAGALPGVRRPAENHRHRHPEGAGGAGVPLPRHGDRPDGR